MVPSWNRAIRCPQNDNNHVLLLSPKIAIKVLQIRIWLHFEVIKYSEYFSCWLLRNSGDLCCLFAEKGTATFTTSWKCGDNCAIKSWKLFAIFHVEVFSDANLVIACNETPQDSSYLHAKARYGSSQVGKLSLLLWFVRVKSFLPYFGELRLNRRFPLYPGFLPSDGDKQCTTVCPFFIWTLFVSNYNISMPIYIIIHKNCLISFFHKEKMSFYRQHARVA